MIYTGTTEVHYFYNGNQISPWHDIPIREDIPANSKIVNFLCEIPKGTTAKNEIHKSKPFNPVLQDRKNGKPRFYKYSDSIVNYGAIPQTWEDPNFISKETGFGGDNDPIGKSKRSFQPMFPVHPVTPSPTILFLTYYAIVCVCICVFSPFFLLFNVCISISIPKMCFKSMIDRVKWVK